MASPRAASGPALGPNVGLAGVDDGFGGRGGRPCMTSSTWSVSSVSHSSSAFAIISTLSRLASINFRASPYCSSMMRLIS